MTDTGKYGPAVLLQDELAEKNEKSKDLEKELSKTRGDLENAQEQLGVRVFLVCVTIVFILK